MTQEEIKKVLDLHKKWLNNEDGGIRADLRDADLHGANLSYAILIGADLSWANLIGADLRGSDLIGSDLRGSGLIGSDLRGSDLRNADLHGADLRNADLRNADLSEANLHSADLRNADLRGAVLSNADLSWASLRGAKNIPFIPMACPDEGSFIGWKKVGNKLIKLEIPEDAKRSSATTNKCRCDKAKVLSITDLDGTNPANRMANEKYAKCEYVVGEMVYPDSFDEDRWNECSHGIHFFVNKQEAINYY